MRIRSSASDKKKAASTARKKSQVRSDRQGTLLLEKLRKNEATSETAVYGVAGLDCAAARQRDV